MRLGRLISEGGKGTEVEAAPKVAELERGRPDGKRPKKFEIEEKAIGIS